jgi:hypothetical protein
MWWIVLIIVFGLFILLRVIIGFAGNWRMTLNRVITQYVAWRQAEPKYSDKQIFMAVLDSRYPQPKNNSGLMAKMHEKKNIFKEKLESGDFGDKEKYNLPTLIFACLMIEENNYMNQKKSNEELMEPINVEVIRQGFKKYC